MPISSHLFRKLQEALGVDAASELSNIVETVDAIRADLAEFRHETRRETDKINARLDMMGARLDGMEARLDGMGAIVATKADLLDVKIEVKSEIAALRSEFKDALLVQTRWILAGLVTGLLAIYFRA